MGKKKTPEGEVKKQVSKVLNYYGAAYRMPVLTGFGKRDLDYYGCYRGLYFTIETKDPVKGELTGRQRERCVEIYKAGGKVFIISDVSGILALVGWLERVKHAAVQFAGGPQPSDSEPIS